MIKTRFITADVPVREQEAVITGRGNGTVKNHATGIFVKRNGEWMLITLRATPVP